VLSQDDLWRACVDLCRYGQVNRRERAERTGAEAHPRAAAAGGRRVYAPVLHVGVPGERVASLSVGTAEPTDPGLRTDVVAALRVRAGERPHQLVWLTRSGGLELQDVDARWLAATRAAYDEARASLVFVVVNRRGWRDPRSGLSRTWVRLRV
jgi:hypothetical protein